MMDPMFCLRAHKVAFPLGNRLVSVAKSKILERSQTEARQRGMCDAKVRKDVSSQSAKIRRERSRDW